MLIRYIVSVVSNGFVNLTIKGQTMYVEQQSGITGILTNSIRKGGKLLYFVVRIEKSSVVEIQPDMSVTFNLRSWRSNQVPQIGMVIQLDELVKFKRGWRALRAYPIQVHVVASRRGI